MTFRNIRRLARASDQRRVARQLAVAEQVMRRRRTLRRMLADGGQRS